MNIKTAVNEAINKITPNLSINEFRSELLKIYPHLNEYTAFNHLSKLYATELGYIFSKTTSIQNMKYDQLQNTKKTDLIIETVTSDNINRENLQTFKTNTPIDILASNRSGFMGGTQYEVSAPAGTGKTTLLAQIAQDLKLNNEAYTALFISAEMDRDDWEIEVDENPSLSGLETLFLLNLDEDEYDYKGVILNALSSADFVIVDSSTAIVDLLLDQGNKRVEVERWLRKNIISISKEKRSTIMVIKHVNKDGETAGSTKDKHMFTGKMVLEMNKTGERCVYFEKNRRGGKNQKRKLFYKKDNTGRLVFDEYKFNNDSEIESIIETTKKSEEQNEKEFALLFDQKVNVLTNLNENVEEELIS